MADADEPSQHVPEGDWADETNETNQTNDDTTAGDLGDPVIPDGDDFEPMILENDTEGLPGDTVEGAPVGSAASCDQDNTDSLNNPSIRDQSAAPPRGSDEHILPADTTSMRPLNNTSIFGQSGTGFNGEAALPSIEHSPSPSAQVPPPPAIRTLNLGNSLLGQPRSSFKDRAQKAGMMDKIKNRFEKSTASDIAADQQEVLESDDTTENTAAATESTENNEQRLAEFKVIREEYSRKKRAGTLTAQQEIAYMQAESNEISRLQKLKADRAYNDLPEQEDSDDIQGLFVSQTQDFSKMYSPEDVNPAPMKRGRKRKTQHNADGEGEEEDNKNKQARPRQKANTNTGAAKKEGRQVPDQDYTDQELLDIVGNTVRKAKKQKGAKAASKRTKQSGKRDGPSMTNMNFMGANVFQETEQTKDLRNQPAFHSGTRRRDDALKQLIASLPEEDRREGQTDRKALDAALKDFTGVGSVKAAEDGNWLVKGMKTTLKHYQILGVAFMRRRENAAQEPKGGILADQMGLGKTLQTLANIINGKPASGSKVRATLIVAAPALVTQWDAEIQKHCQNATENKKHGIGTVIHQHARSRLIANNLHELLMEADIVLTTYHEVARSYPKAIVPPNLTTAAQKDEWWRGHYEKNKGTLHRIRFHRIIVDEAQAIKNHKGHTSMAVRAIDARHHWALTGTPIMNNVQEFYPYFKFLREPHTGSYKIFKENFCTPDDPDGIERLTVFLRKFMIRRTHVDTLFNARLLDLPTPKEHTLWLEFNEVERTIYDIVKNRMIARINSIARTEGLEKKYSHVWTMILRLRQLTGHILLVQGTIIDILEREDFEKLNRITSREDAMSEESARTLIHLRQVLNNNASVKDIDASLGDAVVTTSEVRPGGVLDIDETQETTLGGKHGLTFHFRKYLHNLIESGRWTAIEERSQCSSCHQKPDDPVITSCYHIYCSECLADLQRTAARRGHDSTSCRECGADFTYIEPVQNFASLVDADRSTQAPSDAGGAKKGKKKKNDDDGMDDWIGMRGEVLPSAKTAACKAQVQNWIAEKPDVKIIIYTQFLPIVRILAKVCQTERWNFVKYTGEMSHEARQKAIEEFSDEDRKLPIMLASLRCGGLGLNLTMASRVICFDPWWNESVEQQAFCRVFRIGQKEETRMTRFVVANTIDAAMMRMKERKQREIDEVMNSKKTRLDVKHLMQLFGQVDEDDEGHPFIIADEAGGEESRYRLQDSDDEDAFMGNDA